MPRRRPHARPRLDDRDLAAEVQYLHSLWRRGPPAPVPVPVAAVPNQSRTARGKAGKRKRRRLGRGAGDPEDAGPEWPHAPSPPASPDASALPSSSPEESTPPSPGSPAQEEAISDRYPVPSRSSRRKANKRKHRRLECDAGETQDPGSERPLAPSPPAIHKGWPDGPTSSSPLNPPPQISPGSLAHREALRAAEEFFASHGSDDEEESESEGDEEEAAGFFTNLFEKDAALRGHYERGLEEGLFACMACAGRKARRGKERRFRGCVSLVQHAHAAMRFGRPGAHRALAAVVCRVLGWDIGRLPSIVIDPRGTLGQALAARAQSNAQEAKEDVETEMNGSNTNGDEAVNELETSKESAGMKDVEEIGPLNCKDSSKNNVCYETNQEEDTVKTGVEEHASIDGEKEITELNDTKESSEKENADKDDSLNQDNIGVVYEQDIAIESTKKEDKKDTCSKDTCTNEKHCNKASIQEEVNATVGEPEHAKTADDIGDTAVTRLGNSPWEENVDENKEHANSIS